MASLPLLFDVGNALTATTMVKKSNNVWNLAKTIMIGDQDKLCRGDGA